MEVFQNFLIFALLFSVLETCTAEDTIAVDQTITDSDTLVSANEMYELGFFTPGNSRSRYLGIWYKNISPQTVVWVANRVTPIADSSGVLRVDTNGSLLVIAGSSNTVVWSSKPGPESHTTIINPVAQLLNSGNLVLRKQGQESLIWQSFDYPGDTFLPGMKLGKDLVSGLDRRYTPWKNRNDPSPGLFVSFMNTNGFPQSFQEHDSAPFMRSGPWNGVAFNGVPGHTSNVMLTHEFVFNDKEVYYRCTVVNTSVITRMYYAPDGNTLRLKWMERTKMWLQYGNSYTDICSRYGTCGPNGRCNINNLPACSCIEGFEPQHPEEWAVSEWSGGCRRKTALDCPNGDGFRVFKNVKVPDTRGSWYNNSMTLGECETVCKRNCSCTAYANIYITMNGSGCLLWFGDLMDIRTVDQSQDLYVRMAISDLTIPSIHESTSKHGSSKKRKKMIVLVSLSSLVMMILILAILYRWSKKRRSQVKIPMPVDEPMQTIDEEYSMEGQKDDNGLSTFSLAKICKSTDNFADDKKLGEGGFGPVYMGVLDDGLQIAVKRLSKTSRQGLGEFMNEVKFIAKLQHRNLVKLLGYCIQGDESMLIYEYMSNKSLDSFIFDKIKISILDWSNIFRIIHGIARGLLYLHHDSRFKIVHRDLKASNILLDVDMNPKISDFGLARLFKEQEKEANTNNVVGTLGYLSPEYAVDGTFSEKSDVFSFGVLVLEIVSGKKNRGFSHGKNSDNLLAHAWRLFEEGKALELLGAHMCDSCVPSEALRAIHIGLLCVQHHAEDRPTMLSVILMFDKEGALPQPEQPAFFAEGSVPELNPTSINEVTMTNLEPR